MGLRGRGTFWPVLLATHNSSIKRNTESKSIRKISYPVFQICSPEIVGTQAMIHILIPSLNHLPTILTIGL